MNDEAMLFGVVKRVEINGFGVTKFGDRYANFVATLPEVTFAVPGLDDLVVQMPYQPDIGALYRLTFDGAWRATPVPKDTPPV